MVLLVAQRWGSLAMAASMLIFLINSLDMWTIFGTLTRQPLLLTDGRIWQLLWFSFRNVSSLGYWIGYSVFLYRTKQEVDHVWI